MPIYFRSPSSCRATGPRGGPLARALLSSATRNGRTRRTLGPWPRMGPAHSSRRPARVSRSRRDRSRPDPTGADGGEASARWPPHVASPTGPAADRVMGAERAARLVPDPHTMARMKVPAPGTARFAPAPSTYTFVLITAKRRFIYLCFNYCQASYRSSFGRCRCTAPGGVGGAGPAPATLPRHARHGVLPARRPGKSTIDKATRATS